jgi:hypothetical protein
MRTHSGSCQSGPIRLYYPRASWYEENAQEMLGILGEAGVRLEQALGLRLPPTACYVVEPETAMAIQGTTGAAYRRSVIVGFPERHLSELADVGAHELAHILSAGLGGYSPPFKGEGLACYAAGLIEAQIMPVGVPLHYHLVWLLSVGVKVSLDELWHRRDDTPELYDLAWSFAAFLAERFGRERYFAFYGRGGGNLSDRVEATLGMPLAQLEREWCDHARSRVHAAPSQIVRMRRYPGVVCSRAAWLKKRGAHTESSELLAPAGR